MAQKLSQNIEDIIIEQKRSNVRETLTRQGSKKETRNNNSASKGHHNEGPTNKRNNSKNDKHKEAMIVNADTKFPWH